MWGGGVPEVHACPRHQQARALLATAFIPGLGQLPVHATHQSGKHLQQAGQALHHSTDKCPAVSPASDASPASPNASTACLPCMPCLPVPT